MRGPYRDPLKSSTVNTSYDDRGVCSALEALQAETAGPFWHLQGSRHAILQMHAHIEPPQDKWSYQSSMSWLCEVLHPTCQATPSSPGGGVPPVGLAQKRLMREAEPANSGHSGHTPKAQQRPDLLDMNVQSAWDLHHRQVCNALWSLSVVHVHSTAAG